jgi:hypothetical protein
MALVMVVLLSLEGRLTPSSRSNSLIACLLEANTNVASKDETGQWRRLFPDSKYFCIFCGWAASARCYRPGTKGPAGRASAANKCLRIEIVTDIASAKRQF